MTPAQLQFRDAEIFRLRTQGHTYQHIATALTKRGLKTSTQQVQQVLKRAYEYINLTTEAAQEHITLELSRLDDLLTRAYQVIEHLHLTVSHGKIIRDENGTPLQDTAPILNAINTIVRLMERRAKLLGLDAPTSINQYHTFTTPVNVDAELQEMINEALAANANQLKQQQQQQLTEDDS